MLHVLFDESWCLLTSLVHISVVFQTRRSLSPSPIFILFNLLSSWKRVYLLIFPTPFGIQDHILYTLEPLIWHSESTYCLPVLCEVSPWYVSLVIGLIKENVSFGTCHVWRTGETEFQLLKVAAWFQSFQLLVHRKKLQCLYYEV